MYKKSQIKWSGLYILWLAHEQADGKNGVEVEGSPKSWKLKTMELIKIYLSPTCVLVLA